MEKHKAMRFLDKYFALRKSSVATNAWSTVRSELMESGTTPNGKSMPCEHVDNIYIERNDKGYHFCFDCLTVY